MVPEMAGSASASDSTNATTVDWLPCHVTAKTRKARWSKSLELGRIDETVALCHLTTVKIQGRGNYTSKLLCSKKY